MHLDFKEIFAKEVQGLLGSEVSLKKKGGIVIAMTGRGSGEAKWVIGPREKMTQVNKPT